MAWGIREWYGQSIYDMDSDERRAAANDALSSKSATQIGRPCPFIQNILPGAACNKDGGVCSIVDYMDENCVPAAVCPNRLLASDGTGMDCFDVLAKECFDLDPQEKYAVVKEVPFLKKVDAAGQDRGAKAGRIDWVLVTQPGHKAGGDWLAIETQAVYFSGAKMAEDFKAYQRDPDNLHVTTKSRRPDWRSSGAKRLSPQLDAKSPVMSRWGKKVAVVVDRGFYDEFSAFDNDDVDFDNAEVVWVVLDYDDDMNVSINIERYAELEESRKAISGTRPVNKKEFEKDLRGNVADKTDKVSLRRLP